MTYQIFLIALFLITFEALQEGFKIRGRHTLSASIEFIYLAGMAVLIFMAWKPILGLIFLRFAIFDGILNTVAGQPFFYIGTTKYYDRAWRWFFKITKFPENQWMGMWKLILGLIGLTLLLAVN